MKKRTWQAIGALCVASWFSAAASAAPQIDAIVQKLKDTHTITMGYRETIEPTSFLNSQHQPDGYAVDMCKQIIADAQKELKLPEIKIKYVPINIQNRQALVANGTVDIACGGAVHTFARARQVDFSPVSYVSANQLLVLKDSGIKSIDDLNGKVVAVPTAGNTEPILNQLIAEKKLNIKVLHVDTHAAALIDIVSHRADAYFCDNSAFLHLIKSAQDPKALAVVGPEYGYAPQAFMVPKNNPTFMWIVNHSMAQMFESGQAEKIFNKWFGPYNLKISPRLRAAWETYSYPE
ncbi:MAG TPA: amino acid ABC transporter substrate-binding protein [Castellaniella sp.]|uniref:amino acid ABC transporter substrate-binding protein n=1 Tax=Castellaniella sp. TaxID=1955812 RepID=UPI002F0EFF18